MAHEEPQPDGSPDVERSSPLVERPESLRRFVRAMPSAVILLDDEWRIVARSDRLSHIFVPSLSSGGDEIDTLLGEAETPSFFDVFPDEDGTWRTTFERCLEQERQRRGHVRPLQLGEATTFWVDWEVRPWAGPEGDEQGLILYLTDRTREHRAETMRRQVERRFDALVETIGEGVLLMDNTGVFRDCNAAAEQILGRPAGEIIGSKFNDPTWKGLREDGSPLPNSDFPFWRAYFEREAVRDEVMGIYPPEEPPRWIRVSAQPLFEPDAEEQQAEGNGRAEPYGVLVCFEDITDQQLKDEALQTSRDLLSSVLSSSLDGIMVFSSVRDEFGRIADLECILANPQAEKMVGRASDDIIGRRIGELLPVQEEKGYIDAYVDVIETGEPLEAEIEYDTEEGHTWLQVVGVKVEDGVAITFRDVSERKEAAQAMAAANAKLEQRNRALRDFAYIASHDLQEPLRKISAFSNLVMEDYGDQVDETAQHYMERMQDAAQRMSRLISDLLVYSRVTTRARPFEPVDLEQVIANVRSDLDMQIEDVGGSIETHNLPTIDADPTQMRQLLQNLISNALKFHKEGRPPVVRVEAELLAADETELSARIEADATEICRLTIADNGIGFDQKYADRIFTPFKRLHGRGDYAGTGMGLAICRRIVERHGGDITVSSVPDEGTTFTVFLPVDRPNRGGSEAEDPTTDYATTP
jgi:PAS domain S-box-containing protein